MRHCLAMPVRPFLIETSSDLAKRCRLFFNELTPGRLDLIVIVRGKKPRKSPGEPALEYGLNDRASSNQLNSRWTKRPHTTEQVLYGLLLSDKSSAARFFFWLTQRNTAGIPIPNSKSPPFRCQKQKKEDVRTAEMRRIRKTRECVSVVSVSMSCCRL